MAINDTWHCFSLTGCVQLHIEVDILVLAKMVCINADSQVKVAQSCPTLCDPMDYSPWNSLVQNIGMGSLSLLQGIFLTQESNQGLLALWVDSLPTELSGKS